MTNFTAPLVYEFCFRRKMAKLGFNVPTEEMLEFEMEIYDTISNELIRLENEEIKKKTRR